MKHSQIDDLNVGRIATKVTLAVVFSLIPLFSHAQLISLAFRPVAAEYSSTLDRIIMISSSPNQLHLYNPGRSTDTAINLSKPPLSLSVSPDGLYAAVGHDNLVSYVDLSRAVVKKTFPISVASPTVVLTAAWIHVLSNTYGYPQTSVSLNIATGSSSPPSYFSFAPTGARFNTAAGAIYGTRDGTSPNDVEKIDVSTGPMTSQTDSVYHGDYSVCGPVFFSPDGSRIYTGCGTVFQASTDPAVDMHYTGSLSGISRVTSLAESSALKRIALVPLYFDNYYGVSGDNSVVLYGSDFMNPIGNFRLPDFQAGNKSYAAHGKWVFFNADSTALLALEQADPTSGILNDFRLQIIPLTPPSQCGAAFASATAQVIASGAIASVNITASPECRYDAVSDASWIDIVSGGYGSGDGVLKYIVRANSGPARIGTISMSGSVITVRQDAVKASGPLTRLPYNVVSAEYDKPLNKLVLISAGPNELHIYDPLTRSDQSVPLALAPLSVSVQPDGLYAAIGHDGWVSYVDLQTASVQRVFKVLTDVGHILLAGNGYAYLFPSRDWSDIYSLNIATGMITATSAIYDGRVPRLYADGDFMYVGGNDFSRWEISHGVASKVTTGYFYGGTCGNLWLTEDGRRLITACGSVYRTSSVPSEDLQPNGSFSDVRTVVWADEASIPGVTAVLASVDYSSPGAGELRIYEDAFLQLTTTFPITPFLVEGTNYPGYGQFAFWNGTETSIIVVEKADTSAGLLSGYGVAVIRVYPSGSYSSNLDLSSGGAATAMTEGAVSSTNSGYATIAVNSGTTPYGTAVFSLKQDGVTVTEAGVPASPPTNSARIFIDYRTGVNAVPGRGDAGKVDINTGIAVVNYGSATANVVFTLRDLDGNPLSVGHGTLEAGKHFACFIDQLKNKVSSDFNLPSDFQEGTLEIDSDQQISVLALRGTTNQRSEFLITTTPIADLINPPTDDRIYFPQFADGGGYSTSLMLMNTSKTIEEGTLQILDGNGNPLVVHQAGGRSDSSFTYSIPPGGAFRFQTDGSPTDPKTGWIRLAPSFYNTIPIASGVFSYNPDNILISESGISSAAVTTHARVYVDLSGDHNTGIAIANPFSRIASVTINAFETDGVTAAGTTQGPLQIAANGNRAKFADQFISGLPAGFTGVLDISSATPFAALTLRSLFNEREDFLITTFPVADADQPAPSPILFPHISDGGGYVTQFILIDSAGGADMTLRFFNEDGLPLAAGR